MEQEIVFDKKEQLEKIQAALLPDEQVEAVFDMKGGGTGFIGITNRRVIFQDNAFMRRTKAVVSVPYSRIHAVAAEDESGMFGGRGHFSSSKIVLSAAGGTYEFQFRGADKAHMAHDMILRRVI